MPGISTHDVRRRNFVLLTAVMFAGAIATGLPACSSDSVNVQAADAPIGVQTSQLSVVIENRSGAPLLNMSVGIVAVGVPPFTHLIARMEGAEKRDVSLSQFSSLDGTTFSLRQWKPKSVKVTATDLTNKKYEVQAPWK